SPIFRRGQGSHLCPRPQPVCFRLFCHSLPSIAVANTRRPRKTITGTDSWQRPKPQPVTLSLWLRTSVALAGSTDHLPYSIHYGIVCKSVSALVEEGKFKSLEDLAEQVSNLALGEKLNGEWVKVVVEEPRALLDRK